MQRLSETFEENPKLETSIWYIGVYLILTMIVCILRPVFFDLLILLKLLDQLFIRVHLNFFVSSKLLLGLAIQIILDIAWLCIFVKGWWRTEYLDSDSLQIQRCVAVIASGVLFVYRFIMISQVLNLGYIQLNQGEQQIYSSYDIDKIQVRPSFSDDGIPKDRSPNLQV